MRENNACMGGSSTLFVRDPQLQRETVSLSSGTTIAKIPNWRYLLTGATWRSGYATVCKTVYTSSILVVASSFALI